MMIRMLPVFIFFFFSCSLCHDDSASDEPGYKYQLIVKTDSLNSFREVIYNESDVRLFLSGNQIAIPVSFVKPFRVNFKTLVDSGEVLFTPVLKSEIWATDCKMYRRIIFNGINFSSLDYPNSFLKSGYLEKVNFGSSKAYEYNYYDTLKLVK